MSNQPMQQGNSVGQPDGRSLLEVLAAIRNEHGGRRANLYILLRDVPVLVPFRRIEAHPEGWDTPNNHQWEWREEEPDGWAHDYDLNLVYDRLGFIMDPARSYDVICESCVDGGDVPDMPFDKRVKISVSVDNNGRFIGVKS